MCDHLANPGLLIEVRELQVLSLLSQLVQANLDGFAQCHEEWRNLSLKVSTIWHTSPLSKRPMKTSSMTHTLNFKSGCKTLLRSSDIMYLQQALRQHDAKEFMQAVVKEINGHVDCDNWILKNRSKVPDDIQIVPSI